ncbi:hypothetical protein Bbelb_323660 [Branchiostoma belcheri]|nr:hypothetical protein Bbelb_323660 [Branchiostoma belcheri]
MDSLFLANSNDSFPVLCELALAGNESVSVEGNLTRCVRGEHFRTSQIVNATLILLFGTTGAVGNMLAFYAFFSFDYSSMLGGFLQLEGGHVDCGICKEKAQQSMSTKGLTVYL